MYKGDLVNLRLQTLSDMACLADLQNREHVMESMIHDMPRFTYKEQLEKKFKERMEKRHDNDVRMTIEAKDGTVIGEIGFDFIFWKNGFGYMYHYIGDEKYLDGGYTEEAIALFLEFAFNEANVRKIKAQALANDTRNIEACRRNGFQVEVLYKEEVLKHGNYLDVCEMAVLRDEYYKG